MVCIHINIQVGVVSFKSFLTNDCNSKIIINAFNKFINQIVYDIILRYGDVIWFAGWKGLYEWVN